MTGLDDDLPMMPPEYQGFEFISNATSSYLPLSPPSFDAFQSQPLTFDDLSSLSAVGSSSLSNESLFHANESALFSTFLNTFDENEDFLFNPGMMMMNGVDSAYDFTLGTGEGYDGKGSDGKEELSHRVVAANGYSNQVPVVRQEGHNMERHEGAGDTFSQNHYQEQMQVDSVASSSKLSRILNAAVATPVLPILPVAAVVASSTSSSSRPKSTRKVTAARRASSTVVAASRSASIDTTREDDHRSPSPTSSTTTQTTSKPKAKKGQGKKQPLTAGQKRANHILSEQTRRSAIKNAFRDLVDLLVTGSATSGILLEGDGGAESQDEAEEEEEDDDDDLEDEDGSSSKRKKGKGKSKAKVKPKPKGRGRGRKAEIGNGVAKSVILEQAVQYIKWLERGNHALEKAQG